MIDPLIAALVEVRKDRGMSQRELSRQIGVPITYVSRIERGVHSPSVSLVRRMLDALDHDVAVAPRGKGGP